MEIFNKYTLSDDAKLAVEKHFSTTYLDSADVFRRLCDAQEEILLVQQQKKTLLKLIAW